ncbi:MAG: DivIVA domain-containing protein [Defluviitaleaceae bacterium]|nr:DivIVA domain-containing protein [Defluviitaleaceae bacterium]
MEQFTFVKRGYDPEEVDRYISTLEQVIKSYKEKDNAIKNAIISAQVAADNMIKNAKAQANEYKSQIAKELDKVGVEVERQRMQVQAFQDVYEGLIRKYLTEIDKQEISEIYARLEDVERLIERLKEADIMPAPTPEGMPASNTGYGPPPPREAPPPGFPPLPPAPISNPGLIN